MAAHFLIRFTDSALLLVAPTGLAMLPNDNSAWYFEFAVKWACANAACRTVNRLQRGKLCETLSKVCNFPCGMAFDIAQMHDLNAFSMQ